MIDFLKSASVTIKSASQTTIASGKIADAAGVSRGDRSPPLSRLVGLAAELANQGPPVDYARIAQIRQAIASGTYVLDVAAAAKALIDYERGA